MGCFTSDTNSLSYEDGWGYLFFFIFLLILNKKWEVQESKEIETRKKPTTHG